MLFKTIEADDPLVMASSGDSGLEGVDFDQLENVDQYEATFTGTLDDEEITLTYALESAIAADESTTVYTPGDEELEHVVIQPETYEFETDDRETVRFTAIDDNDDELLLVYVFTDAEDANENPVGLDVEPDS